MARRASTVREPLSRDVIVAGALHLADTEGLDAVTIRRLAKDNGVTPMALYWHFKDKEQLLDGVVEQLFAEVHLGEPQAGAEWTAQLRDCLEALLGAMRAHPAIAGLALHRVLTSDPGLVLADRILGLLRAAGFSPEEAAEIGSYALCCIITLVTADEDPEPCLGVEERDDALRLKKATLAGLSPTKYPNVVACADTLSGGFGDETYFQRGLDLLVAGIAGLRPPVRTR